MFLEVFKTFIFVNYGQNWSSDCLAMRTMFLRCQDGVPPNNVTPNEKSRTSVSWTMRPLDDAALGHVVPDQCILTLDCSEVFVKINEHALKLVTHWLSICKNWLLAGWASVKNWLLVGWSCAKIDDSLANHARKLVTHWLSMLQNWLLVGWPCTKIGYSLAWACAKTGYSLAEHSRKLVTRWLSMHENWFLAGWS